MKPAKRAARRRERAALRYQPEPTRGAPNPSAREKGWARSAQAKLGHMAGLRA